MKEISDKFKRCVMSISFQERKKKELQKYRQEVERLESMETDELDLEYINLKSKYEHKKILLSVFILSIVLSVLMDTWKNFYSFLDKIFNYAISNQGDSFEVAKVVFVISAILIFFITVIILVALISSTKEIYRTHKRLLTVEGIRNKQNKMG